MAINAMCLSSEEVKELTGYSRIRQQSEWLRERGYPFELGGDGVPKVLRSYVVSRLGGKMDDQPKARPQIRLP